MIRSWRRRGGQRASPTRVVLVDDDAFIVDLFTSMLSVDTEFEVVGDAADGEEAIELCGRTSPDVIVVDVTMPVLGGIEALPELRRLCPHAAIVCVSARPAEAEALAAGADLFVLKPEAARNLTAVLARAEAEAARRVTP